MSSRLKPLPILATSLFAPGELTKEDLVRGRSAVTRLEGEFAVAVGAPFAADPPRPRNFPYALAPRGLLAAVEAGRRLEREEGPSYGLVLALSSLHSEPAYLEHVLQHRCDPQQMEEILGFAGDFPLEYVASVLGAHGPRARVDSACASGSDALILAHRWIEAGIAEDVLVVAAASMLDPVGIALFNNIHALSTEDDLTASRPFDRRRKGFVMGEGGAACWLSSRRPRQPTGYLCGHGRSMNAEKFTDMPEDLSAMEAACRAALAGTVPSYICAHGTATPGNDRCETRLYKNLFGERAHSIPVSSLKSMTGHCLGASSLMEVVVTLEALGRQQAPPTLNLHEPDPECDLDYVALEPRALSGDFALSSAFAFGGHNSALLLSADHPC